MNQSIGHQPELAPVPDREIGHGARQPPRNSVVGQRRDGDHVDVLGEEEQRELQRRVLGVEAADQLGLGLRQVERAPGWSPRPPRSRRSRRRPAAGSRPARPVNSSRRRSARCRRPARDDPGRRHRAGVEEHRDDRQPHRDLVADHLRGRAQPAEQRVRRARTPSRTARCRTRPATMQANTISTPTGQVGQLQRGLRRRRSTPSGRTGSREKARNAGTADRIGARK